MSGKTLIEMQNPATQSLDAIKAFLTWKGRAVDPMPSTIEFMQEGGRMVLVLSNKKDSYYVTTATKCSCPSAVYNPGKPCKHIRHYFPQVAKPAAMASESIRPAGKWAGPNGEKANGPVEA